MVDPSRDPHARPRWVKVLGIVALVVVALIIIIMLAGGEHGPGRHTPDSGIGSDRESTTSAAADTGNWHATVGYVIG
jgi:hypothetical protein